MPPTPARRQPAPLYAGHDADLQSQSSFQGVVIAGHNLTIEQSSQVGFLELDVTPPVVSALTPPNGSLLANALPTISASYTDDLSGVDPASVRLLLDGIERTGAAQVAATGISFAPASALGQGSHAVVLTLHDRAGNLAQAAWGVVVDTLPPVVQVTSPPPTVTGTAQPP